MDTLIADLTGESEYPFPVRIDRWLSVPCIQHFCVNESPIPIQNQNKKQHILQIPGHFYNLAINANISVWKRQFTCLTLCGYVCCAFTWVLSLLHCHCLSSQWGLQFDRFIWSSLCQTNRVMKFSALPDDKHIAFLLKWPYSSFHALPSFT